MYPLRPGLSCLYHKMKEKVNAHMLIWISMTLCQELVWLADYMKNAPGVQILMSVAWTAEEADIVIFADACPKGMGFWIPSLKLGYQHKITSKEHEISFLE